MSTSINQLALPGALAKPTKKRVKRNGTVTLVYAPNAQIATIAGKWKRCADGTIEATYGPGELELCEAIVSEEI